MARVQLVKFCLFSNPVVFLLDKGSPFQLLLVMFILNVSFMSVFWRTDLGMSEFLSLSNNMYVFVCLAYPTIACFVCN